MPSDFRDAGRMNAVPASTTPTNMPAAKAPNTLPKPPRATVTYAMRANEAPTAGDLSKIKDLVHSKCHAGKVGDVDAVKMLGARMTLTETTTAIESEAGDEAKVKYTVKGSIDAKGTRTETDIFGKPVEIKAGSMTMSGVTQSGTLTVKKIDGRWVVSC